MMCSYRVESSKGVNQSHYRHSMNTKRNYVFYVTQIEKTHIICRTHFVYVSYLYKSYPRMHDMPRVTIVFGKEVDLNQGRPRYLYYRSLYSKKLSTLYQVTLQVYRCRDFLLQRLFTWPAQTNSRRGSCSRLQRSYCTHRNLSVWQRVCSV